MEWYKRGKNGKKWKENIRITLKREEMFLYTIVPIVCSHGWQKYRMHFSCYNWGETTETCREWGIFSRDWDFSIKHLESHYGARCLVPVIQECSSRFRCLLRMRLVSRAGRLWVWGLVMFELLMVCDSAYVFSRALPDPLAHPEKIPVAFTSSELMPEMWVNSQMVQTV